MKTVFISRRLSERESINHTFASGIAFLPDINSAADNRNSLALFFDERDLKFSLSNQVLSRSGWSKSILISKS